MVMKFYALILLIGLGSSTLGQEIVLPDHIEYLNRPGDEAPFSSEFKSHVNLNYEENKEGLEFLLEEEDTCCFYKDFVVSFSQGLDLSEYTLTVAYRLIKSNNCVGCQEDDGVYYLWKYMEVPYDKIKQELIVTDYVFKTD